MAASIELEDFDHARSKFFHRSMDLNCLASIDGMFVDVNTRWHDVLGYTLDDPMDTRRSIALQEFQFVTKLGWSV